MRLDKFLSKVLNLTRSESKNLITKKLIKVNESIVTKNINIRENTDLIYFENRLLKYQEFIYLALNKPKNFVSSHANELNYPSVYNLIDKKFHKCQIIGRLDVDTTGLLVFTNQTDKIHELLSPKKHAWKTYLVTHLHPLSDLDISKLEKGIQINKDFLTLSSKVEKINGNQTLLSIREGKFHQIKRMFEAINNKVIELERVSFNKLQLNNLNLKSGEYKELNEREIELLLNNEKDNN
ncbi:rRNA pseudouridine synthase [Mycoplasma anatis]|uniref:pseudouridine synthase n=1 Tax=Mycoplasmopsis anatis TaxID=171279 RepID=UPI001C4E22D5|nr:pseudouridine synthase [Mycoplasmopsis anatis]MBW0596170.1 rRNA pseudouridine synthase [Mycoplasmopsis anatis]MBW0596848.1 rRNA pseudouridine synthase [Mycoplasmopsis anatis]MBW0600547.1 rRNA pseudouridine synthase [Mycoplasmopsis anatis]